MPTPRPRLRSGFTMVELLVSIALMGVVVAYLMGVFTTQHRTYVVVDEVTEAQQNARAIADLVEREIRTAGFMVVENAAVCAVDNTNAPDRLYVSDADAINVGSQYTPNLGVKIQAGLTGAAGVNALTVSSLVLDGAAYYDNDNDGLADADFRCANNNCAAAGLAASGVIVVDAANPSRGAACGEVQRVAPPSTLIVNLRNALAAAGAGANAPDLRVVPAHVYAIVQNGPQSVLTRDGLTLANDVEDMQSALWFDVDGNQQVTTVNGEYPGSPAAAGGQVYDASKWDGSKVREVRVNFVVRTRAQDPTLKRGQFQVTENRAVAVNPADGFHRRVYTAVVRLRNVGDRG